MFIGMLIGVAIGLVGGYYMGDIRRKFQVRTGIKTNYSMDQHWELIRNLGVQDAELDRQWILEGK